MRNLTISALALISSTFALAQSGNTWGDLITHGDADPPAWPAALEGIHMCHIPPSSGNQYGRIVMWGHGVDHPDIRGKCTQAYVWDTAPGKVHTNFIDQTGNENSEPIPAFLNTSANFFCGGHSGDKFGNVFIAGGEETDHTGQGIKAAAKFLYQSLSWSNQPLMTHARWYPTVLPLANGDHLVVAGNNENGMPSDPAELYSGNAWSIFDAQVANPNPPPATVSFDSDYYPFMFTYHNAGDQLVYWAGKRRHKYFQTTNEGVRPHILNLAGQLYTAHGTQTVPMQGSGAAIWINGTSTPKKGVIIKAGGNGVKEETSDPPRYLASNQTWYINLDAATPNWTQGQVMREAAIDCNFVWLPTGKLLTVGGSKYDHVYVLSHNPLLLSHSVRTTQLYDPETHTWAEPLTAMPGTEFRWYHSAAVLLPDGSVLVAGSNDEQNGRIYYPSYFGQTRPSITSVGSNVTYGQSFNVGVNMNGLTVEKVTLIRLNATTHGHDQGQRFIKCDFTSSVDNLIVTPPANGAIAPPGSYMLFVVSTTGIPSHARYVTIGE